LQARNNPKSLQAQQSIALSFPAFSKFYANLKRGNEKSLALSWGQFCPPFDSLLVIAVSSLAEMTAVCADIFLSQKKNNN